VEAAAVAAVAVEAAAKLRERYMIQSASCYFRDKTTSTRCQYSSLLSPSPNYKDQTTAPYSLILQRPDYTSL
jgi:hypothetical protein